MYDLSSLVSESFNLRDDLNNLHNCLKKLEDFYSKDIVLSEIIVNTSSPAFFDLINFLLTNDLVRDKAVLAKLKNFMTYSLNLINKRLEVL